MTAALDFSSFRASLPLRYAAAFGALAVEMRTLAARNVGEKVPYTTNGAYPHLYLLDLICFGEAWALRVYQPGARPVPGSPAEAAFQARVQSFAEYFGAPAGATFAWDAARSGHALRVTWREVAGRCEVST